jgi:hypothetical protein
MLHAESLQFRLMGAQNVIAFAIHRINLHRAGAQPTRFLLAGPKVRAGLAFGEGGRRSTF